jgi:hypothetical protein
MPNGLAGAGAQERPGAGGLPNPLLDFPAHLRIDLYVVAVAMSRNRRCLILMMAPLSLPPLVAVASHCAQDRAQ